MKTIFKRFNKLCENFNEINEMDIDIPFISSTYVVI